MSKWTDTFRKTPTAYRNYSERTPRMGDIVWHPVDGDTGRVVLVDFEHNERRGTYKQFCRVLWEGAEGVIDHYPDELNLKYGARKEQRNV